jgi:hypothetical protein
MISPVYVTTLIIAIKICLPTSLFAADPILPNAKLTPGVFRKDLTVAKICKIKWGLDKRHVTESMKQQVFKEYGIDPTRHADFEVDHLVSRELGGADDVRNLWPESYVTLPWNAHLNDRLENHLHELLCAKQITLEEGHKEITYDWTKTYKKNYGTPQPVVPSPTPIKSSSPKTTTAKKKH